MPLQHNGCDIHRDDRRGDRVKIELHLMFAMWDEGDLVVARICQTLWK
jgi:hypothetical protein